MPSVVIKDSIRTTLDSVHCSLMMNGITVTVVGPIGAIVAALVLKVSQRRPIVVRP